MNFYFQQQTDRESVRTLLRLIALLASFLLACFALQSCDVGTSRLEGNAIHRGTSTEVGSDLRDEAVVDIGTWNGGMTDPRGTLPNPSSSDGAVPEEIKNYQSAMGSEIWCLPGCHLSATPDGSPVVPHWCTAWAKLESSFFVLEASDDSLSVDNQVVSFNAASADNEISEYACIRIDLSLVQRDSVASAAGALREIRLSKDHSFDAINGLRVGMNCLPGCVTPWGTYGYTGASVADQRRNRGLDSDEANPRLAGTLPEWCVRGSNGCSPVGTAAMGQCVPENTLASRCTRLKFTDQDEAHEYVE